ncbi:MAG: glycosyltransferase family 2 protein [Bacteroidetes bacterium]|nr:glycosyltransferase family 2 protein [Bacteroidota bacterium]
MAKVAVVILNWNGRKFLEKFLPALIMHSSGDAELIIADNASSDDSISFMKENYPGIRVILNGHNGGFSKGYNEALAQVKADYYILLNSDIEVTPGWIEPLISLMESDKSIAACQPKILSYHDRIMFEYAGGAGGFIDKYGYPFCRGRIFLTLEKDEGQYDDTQQIFWATGACMFVRADLYHQFGGLDNDFFAHMEEIDFCWRMKNAGYKIMYCPDSHVFHVGGGTLPKISWRKTYLNFRNNLILLYKNLPWHSILWVFIVRLFLDTLASLKFLFNGDFKDFVAVSRAYVSFYSSFTMLKIKRKKIPHREVDQIYGSSIVLEYYLRGKKKFSQLKAKRF